MAPAEPEVPRQEEEEAKGTDSMEAGGSMNETIDTTTRVEGEKFYEENCAICY